MVKAIYPDAKPTANPLTGINNNNYFSGGGYAYTDKYGISHVTPNYESAKQYSGDGNIQNYNGAFAGGYALDNNNNYVDWKGMSGSGSGNTLNAGGSGGTVPQVNAPTSTAATNNSYIPLRQALLNQGYKNEDILWDNDIITLNNNGKKHTIDPSQISYQDINGQRSAMIDPNVLNNITNPTPPANQMLNQLLGQMQYKPQQQVQILSYNDALNKAQTRLNPLYDNAMDELQRKLAIDAERSGLDTSQLGNARLNDKLQDFLAQKNSAVSGLAGQMEQQSVQNAQYAEEQAYRQHQGNIQNLLSALGVANTIDQNQFSKDMATANLTGMYNGSPILSKVLADREYEFKKANIGTDNALAQANYALKNKMFEWEKTYKETDDKKAADARAKEIAAGLATDQGVFDKETYDEVLKAFTGQNATSNPFVKSIMDLFIRIGTGAGVAPNSNNNSLDALREAGLIN